MPALAQFVAFRRVDARSMKSGEKIGRGIP